MLLLPFGCAEKLEGPTALAYAGSPDCVEVATADQDAPAVFSAELWVRGEPEATELDRPLLGWPGVFDLAEDKSGALTWAVGEGASAEWASSVMDGVIHHIMGVFDGTVATLFVDGSRKAVLDTAVGAASDTLRIGCTGAGAGFAGVIDEVRISTVARSTEDFTRPTAAFEADDDTLFLFHLDDAKGTDAVDAASGLDGTVDGPEWVEFEVPES